MLLRGLGIVLFGTAVVSFAGAAIIQYDFGLDALQEVPPNASPALGTATVVLNDVTGEVSVDGSFSGLLAPSTAAHIHGLAPPGVNAGVIVPLVLNPLGGTSGTVTGNGMLDATQIQGMKDGLTYVNIHSQLYPGGEIRGQIVPEPASAALLALAGMIALARRR